MIDKECYPWSREDCQGTLCIGHKGMTKNFMHRPERVVSGSV